MPYLRALGCIVKAKSAPLGQGPVGDGVTVTTGTVMSSSVEVVTVVAVILSVLLVVMVVEAVIPLVLVETIPVVEIGVTVFKIVTGVCMHEQAVLTKEAPFRISEPSWAAAGVGPPRLSSRP